MFFIIFTSLLILLRLSELVVSKRNKKWLIKYGAVEFGKSHYPFIVLLHICFIGSLIGEYLWRGDRGINYFLLGLFLLFIILKVWVISSLSKYWNTRIYRIPGAQPVRKGVYKYIRHPNYLIVIAEIALIPLIFKLYLTAIIFSVLNAIMLSIRIKEENKAWNNQ